ncbi:hypothetical protein BC567DRAFT_82876 [Phyllosticta citribraziliensis]
MLVGLDVQTTPQTHGKRLRCLTSTVTLAHGTSCTPLPSSSFQQPSTRLPDCLQPTNPEIPAKLRSQDGIVRPCNLSLLTHHQLKKQYYPAITTILESQRPASHPPLRPSLATKLCLSFLRPSKQARIAYPSRPSKKSTTKVTFSSLGCPGPPR